MNKQTVVRYHDFSMGHAVTGHKLIDSAGEETTVNGPCYNLHGHNYRVYFTVEGEELDGVGRVLDFNVIKAKLCMWLEDTWDHKFLINKDDERAAGLVELNPDGVVLVDYNPTAENLGEYLLNVVGPKQLAGTNTKLISVYIEETRKCGATISLA